MKKKLEMNLLNDEKLHEVMGGDEPQVINPCRAKGDVIDKSCLAYKFNIFTLCTTYEAKCGSGGPNAGFTFACGMGDIHVEKDVPYSQICIKDYTKGLGKN